VGEKVELEVPARADYLAIIRMVVTSFAHLHPEFDDDQIDDLRLAVSEACTNAMDAHRAASTDDRVTIWCSGSSDELEIVVFDRGPGFNPEQVEAAPPPTDPNRLDWERGLGIPLIRALADEAHFSSTGEGTEVRLLIRSAPLELERE
jgi:serine/threonine-protein kinase RsbW